MPKTSTPTDRLFVNSWPKSCTLVACATLALAASAFAFDLTDHTIEAMVQPYPKIAQLEAEAASGLAGNTIVEDAGAANGKSVKLVVANGAAASPAITWKVHLLRGTFSLWCIARSDKEPADYREPMYVELRINSAAGATSPAQSRMRINYQGGVYQDVAHLYFDTFTEGDYELSLDLGKGSRFALLVDRLELRDVLAGTFHKGLKTEAVLFTKPASPDSKMKPYSKSEAMERAHQIAGSFPPRNTIKASGGMDTEGYYKEFDPSTFPFAEPSFTKWVWRMNENLEMPWSLTGPIPQPADELDQALEAPSKKEVDAGGPKVDSAIANKSFGDPPGGRAAINWSTASTKEVGTYSQKDYDAFRAVPCRWPDDGGGYFMPREGFGQKHNVYYNWMAGAFKSRIMTLRQQASTLADIYYKTGDPQVGFRAAVMLIQYADVFPSLDNTVQGTMNTIWGTMPFQNFAGNKNGVYGKLDYSGWAGPGNLPLVIAYDKLFSFIKDNQLLADAIGQDIPWVKSPADVIELLDVKLLQHFFDVCERGQVRFGPGMRCDPLIAIVQGNNDAGRSMLRRIVGVSDYQHPSLLDNAATRHSRDSTTYIGSMFYAKGPGLEVGSAVAEITAFGRKYNLPEFDLTRPGMTPMLFQSAQWLIEPYVTGIHIPGVGDVSGPAGYPTMTLGDDFIPTRVLLSAWEIYHDDRFAWLIDRVYGCPPDTDAAVAERVKLAAKKIARDPRLDQPSRALGGFGVALLESGGDRPDFRERTGVVLRAGNGSGHSHEDQLNIEVFSKGIVAAAEFGGRGGYGTPQTSAPECHNLVEVDGRTPLASLRLVAHSKAAACAVAGSKDIERFISLIDAGGDDAYLFDFVRATGGKSRTYWFHGNQTDFVDPESVKSGSSGALATKRKNDAQVDEFMDALDKPAAGAKASAWKWNTNVFSENLTPGDKSNMQIYQAVWPLERGMENATLDKVMQMYPWPEGSRPQKIYDPNSPRKFTRLIAFGNPQQKVQHVMATSRQVGYRIQCVGLTETKDVTQASIFPAIIEPFAGKSFITDFQSLKITPAVDAFAVEVEVRKDRHDVIACSSDQSSPHTIASSSPLTLTGRFGFVSIEKGPRAAMLVEGTALRDKNIAIELPQARYSALMQSVDHDAHEIVLDKALPASLLVGMDFFLGPDEQSFFISGAENKDGHTVLHFAKTAETYRSPAVAVQGGEVVGRYELEAPLRSGYLTDETGKHGWKMTEVGRSDMRWMPTCFRGGATAGSPIDWDRIPDADGDGKKTLTIGPGNAWTEAMRVEVLDVDSAQRVFLFRPLNSPAGYAGTRSYAVMPIRNEKGERVSTSVIPGKLGSFKVEGKIEKASFADANGDGEAEFRVFYFGPGDSATLPCFASVRRLDDGTWEVTSNSPVKITLPGAAVEKHQPNGDWAAANGTPLGDAVTFELGENDFVSGRALFRIK